MKTITFKNNSGDEIKITNSSPLLLTAFEVSNGVSVYSSKGMLEDGATYISNSLEEKEITLEFAIIATTEEELIQYKNLINKAFNPKTGEGALYYKDNVSYRKINCIANSLPSFTSETKTIANCLVNLTANNPYWTEIEDSKVEIALWEGRFNFPLAIANKGVVMGIKQPSLIVNIDNPGDIQTGMTIEFKARGTLTNPSLFNVNTREYIKINKEMIAGEVIRINTNFNKKKIESIVNGVTTNILNYIDLGGGDTFLQLDTGDNLLRYDAEVNLNNLETNVYFSPKYLGV